MSTKSMNGQPLRSPSVIIIGAGMTGILMCIKLREAGIHDITILEKADRLGGTWRENTYPGVACDIPSHMYTYSFEPNPEWSHRFAHGDEIQQYFERVANKYGVIERIHFNEAVTAGSYQQGKWTLETSQDKTYQADFVICATGILHHPAKPDIPGLQSFKGKLFHTAEWDNSYDHRGKQVGIIGTGSTASQVIPALVDSGSMVKVFQRTPQWIVPVPNIDFKESTKRKWRLNPARMYRLRDWYTRGVEFFFSRAVIGQKIPHALATLFCKLNLWLNVRDKSLREKLTPDYRVGCKRLIVSSKFYPAIQQPNASLITEAIDHISEKGVVTKDGQEHELDLLVLATGFHPFNFMRPMNLTGKNGISIDDSWKNKVQAYRSVCLPDFPNFFLMLGPNTPIGNYSVIAMSEVQTGYVLKLVERWRQGEFDELAPTPTAMKSFNEYLKAGMGKTVWVGGCRSWYLDDDGDPAMWPYTWGQWVKEMAEPVMADFNSLRNL